MQQAQKLPAAQILGTDNCFTADTSSYRIKVSFVDSKLTVTLQDLISFVVYSKVYQEDGKNEDIHKRVCLEDIFYSLTEYCHQKPEQQYILYQFGNVVQQKGVPYFKIQDKGKITVYTSIFDCQKKKQIIYESVLKLDKIRDMTELQTIKQQFMNQKKKNLAETTKLKKEKQQVQNKLTRKKQQIQRIQKVMKDFIFTKTNGNGYSQSIFNKIIPFDEITIFKVKILYSNPNFGIGIVDYEKHLKASSFYDSGFAIGYYSQGQKYPGGQNESIGFRNGQIVEVKVDLFQKLVTWLVDGKIRATYAHQMLGDQTRIFMPYVEIYYQKNSVQWL